MNNVTLPCCNSERVSFASQLPCGVCGGRERLLDYLMDLNICLVCYNKYEGKSFVFERTGPMYHKWGTWRVHRHVRSAFNTPGKAHEICRLLNIQTSSLGQIPDYAKVIRIEDYNKGSGRMIRDREWKIHD